MKVSAIEIPSGLIKKPVDRSQTIENAELRIALEQAVDAADLNLTERLALNKEFFPQGNGFKIIPPNEDILELTTFITEDGVQDEFSEEACEIAMRNPDGIYKVTIAKSDKNSFQTNLDNALEKLYKVFKNSR